jgi:hypothetical protein
MVRNILQFFFLPELQMGQGGDTRNIILEDKNQISI